ncbi:MAG: tocopherol cyclase family protein [Bacteroidota bacterium]
MTRSLSALLNPERFQGHGKTRSYFEGWYFKLVSPQGRSIAVIPGIAFDETGAGHAFVQVLDGNNKSSRYLKFPVNSFMASSDRFLVTVGGSVFSDRQLTLNLDGLEGSVMLKNTIGWPKPWYSPGIMGPFAFIPFMECYHGIVSMDHGLEGYLTLAGERIDLNGGRGYVEKDWGRSFPSAYTWMQSNHVATPGMSLKCSVARIPWLGSSFTGFIAGCWLGDRLIRFTTYNRSALRKCLISEQQVEIALRNPDYDLDITATREQATMLASPIRGAMEGRIQETMDARLTVKLTRRSDGATILDDTGVHAGLEVAGEVGRIAVSRKQ